MDCDLRLYCRFVCAHIYVDWANVPLKRGLPLFNVRPIRVPYICIRFRERLSKRLVTAVVQLRQNVSFFSNEGCPF